jgi:hypothetical protein
MSSPGGVPPSGDAVRGHFQHNGQGNLTVTGPRRIPKLRTPLQAKHDRFPFLPDAARSRSSTKVD